MSIIKIEIFRGRGLNDKILVSAKYVETDSTKKLTAKKAGQILANNFPQFDELGTRNGLQRSDEGFLAMQTLEPTEKCDYHYVWEYALVTDESE